MRWLIATILPLTGCLLSDDHERIAPVSEFHLMTRVADTASITFEHYGDSIDFVECLVLPEEVSATLDGVPLDLVTRGGYDEQTHGCVFPKLELIELPEVATASIVIRDPLGTGTHTCSLGDTLERLTLAVPGPLPAGQSTSVQVTDLPGDTSALTAYLVSPTGHRQEVGRAMAGDTVSLAIPSHYRGAYELRVLANHNTALINGPCGILLTQHQGRQTIEVTGP